MKPEIRLALEIWAEDGREPGGFLQAVLRNDLAQAVFRADDENLAGILEIVRYVWNSLPSDSHGSPEKVTAWKAHPDPDYRRQLAISCRLEG